ncbi:site-specific integrase [Pseudomonas aeruginosa]|uniref:site-specific integrase n=1 Tax=Pseudomonas aeruginosa TaxID=287 RepID=UPI0028FF4682|nr:site-specific integrase [Pseudomonas aeruginosa]MDU0736323.1 site-specific integrase [Pseudomonas aeruginosa]
MAYITRRGAVYYLNLRLPKHLYPRCHTLRLSLGIRDRRAAIFLASTLAERVHQHIAAQPLTEPHRLRLLCTEWRDSTPAPSSVQSHPRGRISATGNLYRESPTLGSLSKLYIEEGKRSGAWRTGNTLDVERALREFFELMDDQPALAFGVEQARTLKDRLSRCPQYFAQRPEFKGMTLRQVLDSSMVYQTITAVTINNRLRKLTAFFNWCKSNGYINQNPLVGMKVMAGAAKDARLSFDRSDLRVLLNLDTLRLEAHKHPWRLWLPLLARSTGARLEELCQLHTDDFVELQGIPCLRIDDSKEGQKLKNQSSRRTLPVHPAIIRLGLLEYVASIRANEPTRIFPDLKPTRGKYGHAPSKWFSRYRMKVGINDPRKSFHSFRHTFIDDLREAGVQDSLVKQMAGHEDHSVTFRVYGSRLQLTAMLQAVQSIEIDHLS